MNSTTRKKLLNALYYILGVILLVILFQVLVISVNNTILVPNINEILKSLFELLTDSDSYLFILNTLLSLIISLGISVLVGFVLGVISGANHIIEKILKPLFSFLRCLPLIALIVVLMIVIGFNNRSTAIWSGILIMMPIIYENTLNSVKSVDKTLVDVWKMESKLNPLVVWKVYLPMSIRFLAPAITTSLGFGIKVIVTCEYITGIKNTLGQEINIWKDNMDYSKVYAYSIILVLLVIFVEVIPKLIVLLIGYIQENKNKNAAITK